MRLSTKEIAEVKQVLGTPKKIVITTHRSPDGDALGSSLAVWKYMKMLGHEATVVVPNNFPDFYRWMPGVDEILVHENNGPTVNPIVKEADIIFCLDYNALHRMERLGHVVAETKALRILIDHHQQPENIARIKLSDVTASSTCELVYDFIDMLGDRDKIDKDIAVSLYVGILTDTGSFRFNSTTAHTHSITADLIDRGVDIAQVYGDVFDTNTVERIRLLGYCLSEKLKVFPEHKTAYISLSMEEMERFNFKKGDDEGLVNYGLQLNGYRFAVLFTESEKYTKISLRSKGDFSVNQIAREHYNGGGHNNAAGGYMRKPLEEVTQHFESILPTLNLVPQD